MLRMGIKISQAWTEWIPGLPKAIDAEDFNVSPGDSIRSLRSAEADVIFTNAAGIRHRASIEPSDETNVMNGNNIEWVIGRLGEDTPPSGQLLHFSSISFSACVGLTAKIAASSFPKDGVAIDLLNKNGGVAASTVADTSGNGDSFTVTWRTG
ncbi:hypothetical protein BJ875DRAFT_445336 [Amylocarpus encephaloides]|uniref:Uncharacterized protein n=1 Tax=Amylocarpus encephaloides TaxID=45428 RepID=A0A9P7YAD1_9HELO|nr:hypothetical protein BJ875DRAFT_445336 [Amylocarpus encephaloides]